MNFVILVKFDLSETMVDTARQLLDELMGRNRNLDPNTAKIKKIQWDDQEVSATFLLAKYNPSKS